jgi:hypothetical protein
MKNKTMLKYIKTDSFTYEVRVESSDLLIGQFIMSDDGFYYFLPGTTQDGGLWSDYTLIAIGNKLKIINQPWAEKVNTVLSK